MEASHARIRDSRHPPRYVVLSQIPPPRLLDQSSITPPRVINTVSVPPSTVASNTSGGTRLLDLAPESLNNIFELVVVDHHQIMGQKRPIHSRSYTLLTRNRFRAMLTCKRIHEIMEPMYYGQDDFIFVENIEVQDSSPYIMHGQRNLDPFVKSNGP